MNILPKPLRKDTLTLYASGSCADLQNNINQYLSDNRRSPHFSGTCATDGTFTLTSSDLWVTVRIGGTTKPAASIQGSIYTNERRETVVDAIIKPHILLTVFFFLFPAAGIAARLLIQDKPDKTNMTMVLAVFCILAPLLTMLLSYYAKRQIKNIFITTFALKEELNQFFNAT